MVHWSIALLMFIIGGVFGFGTFAIFSVNRDEDEEDREWLERNRK